MSASVVVGYDGSDQANDALALGRLLAGPLEAELVITCVYPPPVHFPYTGMEVVEQELRGGAPACSRARCRRAAPRAGVRRLGGPRAHHVR
jgi:hypothetical protein